MTTPNSPASGALPADTDILALNKDERFFSESPSKYPEAGHGTQYHAGAPGVLGFARAVLSLAALASREASSAPLTNAAQTALDAYEDRFESTTGACNYIGPIDEEMIALRRALASPQAAPVQPPEPAIWLTQKEFYVLSKAKKTERETVPLYLAAPAPVAPTPAQPSQWQPIEKAPKDGRSLLLGVRNSHGNWRTMRGQWVTQEDIDTYWDDPEFAEPGWHETAVESETCWAVEPTHWMPLPSEPEGEA